MTNQPDMTGAYHSIKLAAGSFTEPGVLRFGPADPPLTPEECIAAGGHCHSRTWFSRPSMPPQYQEACKHCGHVRWAIPREAFEYREDPS